METVIWFAMLPGAVAMELIALIAMRRDRGPRKGPAFTPEFDATN